jgi:hypothetical protein
LIERDQNIKMLNAKRAAAIVNLRIDPELITSGIKETDYTCRASDEGYSSA